jgi:hypothetical protein
MAVHRLDPALRSPHRKAMNLPRIILNQALKASQVKSKSIAAPAQSIP